MTDILNDPMLDLGEKAVLHQQLLRRYLTFQRARPADYPIPSAITATTQTQDVQLPTTPTTTATTHFRGDDDVEKEIYHTVPRKFDETTTLLIEKMKKHKDVLDWAPTGELVYKNKLVPNTSIVELIGDLVHPKRKATLAGIDVIRRGLSEIDFPEAFLPKRPSFTNVPTPPTKDRENSRGRARVKRTLRSQMKKRSTTRHPSVRKERNRWDTY
jgi:hypothetical protein